ncbi:MAG: tetratricopeptide repeat protein [Caldimonas sp.]
MAVRCGFVVAAVFALNAPARAIDLAPLWNFSDVPGSEQRFRDALATTTGDDALILQTQIARTYGLRNDFPKAREILRGIEPQLAFAGAEARARHALELGRTYASAAHPAASIDDEAKTRARAAFLAAHDLAKTGQLDGLAIDALHMMAFVDTAPDQQLRWGERALEIAIESTQPAAKRWEPSLRNNIGYALHELGRYDEALAEFRRAVVLREKGGDAAALRDARWMEAWTLRALKRIEEAIAIQTKLETEYATSGTTNRDVFEELELLYRAKGDASMARRYAERKDAAPR